MTTLKTIVPCIYNIDPTSPVRGTCLIEWDSSDPLAVALEFENADETISIWTVGRDIIVDCLLAAPGPQFGEGDFRTSRGTNSFTAVFIGGDGDTGEVQFPLPLIMEFFKQSLHCVPRGQEKSIADSFEMDEWLESVLAEADDA